MEQRAEGCQLLHHCGSVHDPVAIGGHQSELSHPPGFIADCLANPGAGGLDRIVEAIDIVDFQVRVVGVIPEFRRIHGIRTLARHDHAGATVIEEKARIRNRLDREPQHIAVERSRRL